MSWSIGFDTRWSRDIGYGVPATCDHPDCDAVIDRGLSYVCCGSQPYGGPHGCGLYFCGHHLFGEDGKCERCSVDDVPFSPKPDSPEWINHKLTDESWAQWRVDNPDEVKRIRMIAAPAQPDRRKEAL